MLRLQVGPHLLQDDGDEVVEGGRDTGRDVVGFTGDIGLHGHDVGARDVVDVDVVVHLAAVVGNHRPLSLADRVDRIDDVGGVHGAAVLAARALPPSPLAIVAAFAPTAAAVAAVL